jgi:hypothetical protein
LNKPDWEITATTVYCDAVDDEVTLILNANGTLKCTGRDKYLEPDKDTVRAMRKKNRQRGKRQACPGNECTIIVEYRNKILDDENKKSLPLPHEEK